jgi:undecaprenyl-diphosphatase
MLPDLPLFMDINSFARATPWLHGLIVVYTTYGEVLFAVLLAAGLWVARGSGDARMIAAALWAPLGMLCALAINQPISAAVAEVRPCRALPGVLVLAHCGTDFSFPSDHATMAGAVAVGVSVVTRRLLAWIAVVAALLMACSRVYVAAHYPHDVLAGLLIGSTASLVGWLLVRGVLTRVVTALQATRLRPLLSSAPFAPHRSDLVGSDPVRPG